MFKRALLIATTLFSLIVAVPAAFAANTLAIITTSAGDIEVELDNEKAPISVRNFVDYAKSGFYNGTIFHRVIPGFMVQGGGLEPSMVQKQPSAPIKNEASNGLKNQRGTLAMARTSVIDSATSQFFINLVDNDFLDYSGPSQSAYGYAVFGHVVKGMDVVDKIAFVKTGNVGRHQNVPLQPITIISVKVIEN